jgi:hypothetical protein
MASRNLTLDLREKAGHEVIIRSDSTFSIGAARSVYSGIGYPELELIYDKDMCIYENFGALEKGICIDKELVECEEVDGGRRLVLAGMDGFADVKCGRCRITTYKPERVALEVHSETDCFLVFQDLWFPGWKAFVDDKETEILRTDVGVRAIEIERGGHTVLMAYEPQSLRLGMVLTFLGIALTAVYATKRRK